MGLANENHIAQRSGVKVLFAVCDAFGRRSGPSDRRIDHLRDYSRSVVSRLMAADYGETIVFIDGEEMPLREAAARFGVDFKDVCSKMQRGFLAAQALGTRKFVIWRLPGVDCEGSPPDGAGNNLTDNSK